MDRTITCIVCPVGCSINVKTMSDEYIVEGHQCERGYNYALEEVTAPKRTLTTTVRVKNGIWPRLPVRTEEPIPKELIFEVMALLERVEVEAPVVIGQVVVENVLGTGVNVVASRSMGVRETEETRTAARDCPYK